MYNLLATFIICLGMSNGMPISDYIKNREETVNNHIKRQNVVNEYNLNIYGTNKVSTNISLGTNPYKEQFITKIQFSATSNYLNVIGEYWHQQTENDTNLMAYINELNYYTRNNFNITEHWQEGLNSQDDYLGNIDCYIMQITPYNFNVNTTIEARLRFNFESDYNTNPYNRLNELMEIWQSTDQNWIQYIGNQPTTNIINNIHYEITDINNAYSYTYYNDWAPSFEDGNLYYLDLDLNITPGQTNFYFITFTSFSEVPEEESNQEQWTSVGKTNIHDLITSPPNQSPRPPQQATPMLAISGTNVIPDGTWEVIDIPGIMFDILGMPFAFITQALNLTLFPGTPYQVNISNLFLAIIALFVFIFIIKIIITASKK